MSTIVYTDGACLGNPGPGGWGWAIPGGAHASGADPQTTNQRMEIMAALQAVESIPGPLTVISDSTYVVKCFTDRWYVKWEANGWQTSGRKPVVNQDLWKPLVAQFHERGAELKFQWVKGHSGDTMNDVVDRLATEAARRQVGRRGDEPPVDLGEADDVRGSPTAPANAAAPPAGFLVVVIGHRPPELGGYGDNPVATATRDRLTEVLRGMHSVHADLVVLTGLGLGAEQLGAEAAAAAGVPYVAVLAFPDPDSVWPVPSRAAFRLLLDAASETIVLSAAAPATKQAAGMAIGKRNSWLVTNANAALAVWDGEDRALRDDVRALERRIPDDVWIIPPER